MTRAPTSPRPRRSRPACRTRLPESALNRFAPPRPRSGEHRRPEGRLGLGGPGPRRWRRIDVARTDGLRWGAWAMDPETNYDTSFQRPQDRGRPRPRRSKRFTGTTSTSSPSVHRNGRDRPEGRPFRQPRDSVRTSTTWSCSTMTSSSARGHDRVAGQAESLFSPGWARWDSTPSPSEIPLGRADRPRSPRRQLFLNRRRRPRSSRLAARRPAKRNGMTPRARIATAVSGADPTIALTAPGPASKEALEKAGPHRRRPRPDRDQRGFAAVALRLVRDLDVDMEGQRQRRRVRHGPPARRDRGDDLGTIVDELERTGGRYGLCHHSASAAAWESPPSSRRV